MTEKRFARSRDSLVCLPRLCARCAVSGAKVNVVSAYIGAPVLNSWEYGEFHMTDPTKQQRTVFSFACRVANAERWGETIYNAHTAGAAKEQHWRHVSDAWDGIKYTDIRARKVGAPHSSEQFIHNAHYRGMPDVRCGQRVRTNGCDGVIVGHNSSANFDVLFESGRYAGQTLNVHPSEIELVS